ncbi:MAG: M48 family metallopeptidase [Candidatus Accumulibacter sp.]|jgi:Zn-dependent protease with chaperone function|nr:M48 family metallopeptidase [Accumulibacter sp.]
MDFFGEQTRARRKTRWLVFWFLLAVVGIVIAVHVAVTLVFAVSDNGFQAMSRGTHNEIFFHWRFWDVPRFFWTFAIVGGMIALASLYKIHQISRMGGVSIALELGGRPVPRNTGDPLERRLVNVLDEVSIAAGIPAPQAFVLDDEPGLNAFAAGMNTGNSVVAVTRGLLDRLNRDQLQGVIGHEISHIVNGDSRLNLRIVGILHGIFFLTLAGRVLTRARGRNSGPILSLGVLLFLIGGIGIFFGRLIQAAVSREREYLADASAVQFTRNPAGLAGALRQLLDFGSRIQHPRAEVASHFFFAAGRVSLGALFATHPPLEARIARIDKNFVPERAPRPRPAVEAAAMRPEASSSGVSFLNGIGASGPAQMSAAQALLATLPESLRDAVHHAEEARAVVYALFLSSRTEIREAQLSAVQRAHAPALAETARARAQWLSRQGARYRLPLLDLALPTLRELAAEERNRFLETVDALIKVDGRVSASEFALRQILKSALNPRRTSRAPIRLEHLNRDIGAVLALLVHVAHPDGTSAAAAFHRAVTLAPTNGPWKFPEPEIPRPKIVEAALDHLARAAPRFREKLLAACVAAIEHDGKITVAETELLRALAQSLDCPVPIGSEDRGQKTEDSNICGA